MKSTKNKTFRIQQRNQHLKNILEEGYYIELGTISTKTMEKLIHGELIKLDEVYHEMILTEGIGRITEESKNEVKFQFAVLNSLRNKMSSNKIFLTCGLLHYHLNDETEYYAPIVLIPVEIDYNEETIIISSKPIINNILINEIQAHLGVDISQNDSFKNLYSIHKFCVELAESTGCSYSIGNYLTVVSVEYTENTLNFDDFSTERSIYEIEPKVILQNYFEQVKSVTPTNIYQKRALLKINNGESFVVDGKIATGKTTTILNTISNAIQKNKKVLYVSQDTDSIHTLEKELRKYQMGSYAYNLCKNYQILNDDDNIIPNIREEKIGIETITPMCVYEDALYASTHGCNYAKIATRLAVIKNQMPEIQKIPIEVSLENHEIQEIYQKLKEIEIILDEIEPLDVNVWSNVEHYYTRQHAPEIIEATKRYGQTLRQFNKEMTAFIKKYDLRMPSCFINAQRLISYISTFEKLMPPSCWGKKFDPRKINELLETISSFQTESRQLNDVYNEFVRPDYVKNTISELVKVLCYKHLTIENEYELNNLLSSHDDIKKAIQEIADEQKNNTKALLKLSNIICNADYDKEFFKYIELIINLIDKVQVKTEWVDFYIRNSNYIFDHYQKMNETINRYLTIKEKLSMYLLKEKSLTYTLIKDLSNNKDFVKQIIQLFNKKLLRQNRISTDECCKMVIDLLELGETLLTELKGTNVIDREPLDTFILKYKVWIDFILALDKKTLRMFNVHVQKNKGSIVSTDDLKSTYAEFNNSKEKLEIVYDSLSKYGVELNQTTITGKNMEIVEWVEYLNRVVKTLNKLTHIYNKTDLSLDDLIKIMNCDREYANLENSLNVLQRQMKEYLGTAYRGLETDVLLVSVLEKHYSSFMDSLVSRSTIVDLHSEDKFKDLVEENKKLMKLTEVVQVEHNLFSRFFIGGQSNILECSLNDSVKKIHRFEERVKELKPLFQIFEHVRYFDKLGLKSLADGILESKYSKGISEIYIYSTYLDYQLELINKNPILSESSNILIWLENYNYFERNYCISSIKYLKRNKIEVDKRILNKVKKYNFNSYQKIINELINFKNVFLMDLNIFNSDLDLSGFDLVLIDDANLSTGFKYNPIMDCQQVVLFGDSTQTINNSNSIFSQIPKRKILCYPTSYIKSNAQYGIAPTDRNQYILDYKRTQIINQYDDLQTIVAHIVNNFYQNTTKEINILVHTNNYKVQVIKELVKKLKEFFSDEDIFDLLEKNITFILVPNESTKVCDEVYILYDDFIEMTPDEFKNIVTIYTTATEHVYIYSTIQETTDIEDVSKHITSMLKYHVKEDKVMPELIELVYKELLERGVKAEYGYGRLDLIVKGKIIRGKQMMPNVGIMIEGLESKMPYSILNDYQFFYNEYTKNGWKIYILFVDDIINNLQTRLDQISKFLSKDDQHITHQLKIDEFLG